MSIELTLAKESDIDEIMALYRAVGDAGRQNGSSDWDETYPTRDYAEYDLAHDGLFVYRVEGRILAAASMRDSDDLDEMPLPWADARSCVLARLCVSSELQGRGMGAQMVRACAAIAKSRGCEAIHLMTPTINLAANRLYHKLGFRELGHCELDNIDFVCYEGMIDELL